MVTKKVINVEKEEFDPKTQIKEYKRTCNECKKTWHSLASREEKINAEIKDNSCRSVVAACGMCGGSYQALGASNQSKRNEHALTDELNRLKKCPNCGSGNYTEKVIIYDKKE
jgi:DNA repair exonuclease SbcCD ATPase subunit